MAWVRAASTPALHAGDMERSSPMGYVVVGVMPHGGWCNLMYGRTPGIVARYLRETQSTVARVHLVRWDSGAAMVVVSCSGRYEATCAVPFMTEASARQWLRRARWMRGIPLSESPRCRADERVDAWLAGAGAAQATALGVQERAVEHSAVLVPDTRGTASLVVSETVAED